MSDYLQQPLAHWIEALRSEDALVRRLAAYALGEVGRDLPEAEAALREAIHDRESFVRVWAAASLVRVASDPSDVVPLLAAGLRDEPAFVRSLAAWHLGRIGPIAPGIRAALPDLQRALDDPDPSVRTEAALAIRRLEARHTVVH